jgi:transposase
MTMDPTNLLHPLKLTVVSVKEEDHDYHFHVETPEPRCCEACGVIDNWVKFGKEDQSYRDVPIHHKRVTIWLIRRRYKCNACGGTFRPHLAEMDDRRMMTKRLSSYVEKAASMGSNSDVARGVDFVGQVSKPWRRTTRRRTVNVATQRLRTLPASDVFAAGNSYLGLMGQADHGHADRARVARVLRGRGFVVKGDLSKIYQRRAA